VRLQQRRRLHGGLLHRASADGVDLVFRCKRCAGVEQCTVRQAWVLLLLQSGLRGSLEVGTVLSDYLLGWCLHHLLGEARGCGFARDEADLARQRILLVPEILKVQNLICGVRFCFEAADAMLRCAARPCGAASSGY
jgi:hypothetical protein